MSEKINKLGSKPVCPLLLSMAFPPMISMLIQSMYNIVDSIFVAQISQDALTAVSLVYPLQNIILAVALGTGIAINSGIARHLGAGNREKANETATHGFLLAGIHFLIIATAGALLIGPFLQLFSTDASILQWSREYATVVVLFSFGSIFQIAIENMFVATGRMVVPMLLQGVGAVVNIILDPIFIFGLLGVPAMGVKGAAIATVIGQLVACVLAVGLFFTKQKELKLSLRRFRPQRKIIKDIYSVAIPSALMLSLPSVLVGILNGILMGISQTAVALFGLYYKLQTFVYMPCYGLMQALRPIVGYNYGAQNAGRVKSAIKLAMGIAAGIMAAGTILFLAIPKEILGLFNATEELVAMGAVALRIICLGFVVSSFSIILTAVFEALGKGFHSLFISLFRQVLFIPPLAILLCGTFGLTGVWLAFPIAEGVSALMALALYLQMKRKDHTLNENAVGK